MYSDIMLPPGFPMIAPRTPLQRPPPSLHQVQQEQDGMVQPSSDITNGLEEHQEAEEQSSVDHAPAPVYHRGTKFDRLPYWQKIGRWKDVSEQQFLSYRWNVSYEIFLQDRQL